jgi:hypothetical protein
MHVAIMILTDIRAGMVLLNVNLCRYRTLADAI